jgi:hypothetical protein
VPDAICVPQVLLEYKRTIVLASAVPLIVGLLLFTGEVGVELPTVGTAGAVESSTYISVEVEQAEALPAASVAVAQ